MSIRYKILEDTPYYLRLLHANCCRSLWYDIFPCKYTNDLDEEAEGTICRNHRISDEADIQMRCCGCAREAVHIRQEEIGAAFYCKGCLPYELPVKAASKTF